MKQKRFTFFLALIASAGTLFAQTLVDGNYYTYDEETHGMAFIGCYHNEVVNLTIPPSVEIDGKIYSVTKIEYQACKNYTNLKSVSLPSTIVAIEGRAFEYCKHPLNCIL